MKESTLRGNVLEALRPWHAQPVENTARPGCPDVECLGRWIELKMVDRWPARDGTPLVITTFSTQQRNWLRRRWAVAPGTAWLMVQVGREIILLDGAEAAVSVGLADRADLLAIARFSWHNVSEMKRALPVALRILTDVNGDG